MNNNFALNPADAVQGIIDWSTPLGAHIAKHAPKPLFEEGFEGTPEELALFLRIFKMRGNEYGWFNMNRPVTIGDIREDPNDPNNGNVYNFVDNYGNLTTEEIAAHARQYMFNDDDDSLRAQQDDNLALRCLTNSIALGLKNKVMLKESDWMVANPANADLQTPSAMLFLKAIIDESSIQTNATTSAIRTRLSELDKYIVQIESDIGKLNEYVDQNVAALTARGEQTTDLLVNLWKAYKNCQDKTFADFMKRRHEEYEMSNVNLEPKELMNLALNKFKLMKESNTWRQLSEDDKKILALEGRVSKLANKSSDRKKNNNSRNNGNNGRRPTGKPKIMLSAPKDPHTVVQYKGKPWYYCCKETGGKCEGKWRAHEPSQCKGLNYHKAKAKNNMDRKPPPKEDEGSKKKLKLAKAMSSVANNESDEEDMSNE